MVLSRPRLVGFAVMVDDPRGVLGRIKKGLFTQDAKLLARQDTGAKAATRTISTDLETSECRTAERDGINACLTMMTSSERKVQFLNGLRKASAVIAVKASKNTPSFSIWLTGIAADAAKNSSKGDFGGVRRSDSKNATHSGLAATFS